MWRGILKLALTTLHFGVVHGYLTNPRVEAVAATLVGKRVVTGLYRFFYFLQSLAQMAALVLYISSFRGRDLYRARGPGAWLLHAGQAVALAHAAWADYHVRLADLTGWDGLTAW